MRKLYFLSSKISVKCVSDIIIVFNIGMKNIINKIPPLERLYIYKSDLFNRLPVRGFTGFVLSLGITPNKLTILGIGISAISIVFLFENTKLFAIFYLFGRFIDIWDGYMAREFKKTSNMGDKLDHIGDMSIHSGLLIKAIFYSGFPWLSGIALATFIGEYLLLRKGGLLKQKFPSGLFCYFFIFEYYRLGLMLQIIYQVISYLIFVISSRFRSARQKS